MIEDGTLKKANILIVDDQETDTEILENTLLMEGFDSIDILRNPLHIFDHFRNSMPDLLLIDLKMAILDGYGILPKIRESLVQTDYFPILVLNREDSYKAKKMALIAGATDIISRPCDPSELTFRVRNLLFTRFLHKQLKKQNILLEEKVKERTSELEEINRELNIAKEKAEESEKLKSSFLANISHEIRTPLNGILGFSNLIKNQNINKNEVNDYLSIIERSGIRLMNTIEDIVNLSKIEIGSSEVYMSDFNIDEEMENLHFFYLPDAANKNLVFNVLHSGNNSGMLVRSDKQMFSTIVSQLIKNSIKFTEKGNIEMGCSVETGTIKFFIRDTGIGISEDRLETIFDRFVQADLSVSRPYEGSGIGLSIAKAFVTTLKGEIWVESKPGTGSVFHFNIPVETSEDTYPDNTTDTVTNITAEDILKELSILIAEDDDYDRLLLSTLLNNKCGKLFLTADGEEAVTLYRNNMPIDIVLMDIKMEKMDGYEATERIKSINEEAFIIAHTSYAMDSDKENAIKAGFSDYLIKPFKMEKLYSIIENRFNKNHTEPV